MKRSAILLLTGLASLLAQSESFGAQTLLRFTSIGSSKEGEGYVLSSGTERSSLFAIPTNGFSVPVAAPTSKNPIVVGKADGATVRNLATLKLPETGKRFLVLLFPDKDDAIRTAVIRADDPAFRPGDIMLFNQSEQRVEAELGDNKLNLEPGSETIFRPTRKDELPNYQVRFFQVKEDKSKLFAASLWSYFNDKRAFVFFYQDPVTGSLTYRAIDEFTAWLQPARRKK